MKSYEHFKFYWKSAKRQNFKTIHLSGKWVQKIFDLKYVSTPPEDDIFFQSKKNDFRVRQMKHKQMSRL